MSIFVQATQLKITWPWSPLWTFCLETGCPRWVRNSWMTWASERIYWKGNGLALSYQCFCVVIVADADLKMTYINEWTYLNYRKGSSARMIPLQLPLHIYLQYIPENYAGYGFWCSVLLFCCSHLIMKLTHVLQGCYTGKLPLTRLPDCKDINHENYG